MYSNGFSYLLKSLKISPSKMAQAFKCRQKLSKQMEKWVKKNRY